MRIFTAVVRVGWARDMGRNYPHKYIERVAEKRIAETEALFSNVVHRPYRGAQWQAHLQRIQTQRQSWLWQAWQKVRGR